MREVQQLPSPVESLPSSPDSAMSLSPESSPTPSPASRSASVVQEDDEDEGRGTSTGTPDTTDNARRRRHSSSSSSEEDIDTGAAGAVVYAAGTDTQAIFHNAVRNGDYSELRDILTRGRGMVNVNSFDDAGQTALHQSCRAGNLELVKLLVRNGADTTLATRDGWSALHIAVFGGYQDIVVYLISHPPTRS